jgi:hypothetical protein
MSRRGSFVSRRPLVNATQQPRKHAVDAFRLFRQQRRHAREYQDVERGERLEDGRQPAGQREAGDDDGELAARQQRERGVERADR